MKILLLLMLTFIVGLYLYGNTKNIKEELIDPVPPSLGQYFDFETMRYEQSPKPPIKQNEQNIFYCEP